MQIRAGVKADLESICKLANELNQFHYENEPNLFTKPDGVLDDIEFWQTKIFSDDSIALVCEINEEIHGFIFATLSNIPTAPFLHKSQYCLVRTIVVSNEQQKNGLGKRLLEEVEQWAKAQNIAEIRLEVMEFNRGAQSFYAKQGYHTQSRVLAKSIV